MSLQWREESWGHMELLCVHWWYSADDSQLGCSPKRLLDLVALWRYFIPCCGWKWVGKHLLNHVAIAFFLTQYKELHKNRVMIDLSLVFLCILKVNNSLPSSVLQSQKSEKILEVVEIKFSTNPERTIVAFLLYQTVPPNYILTNLQMVRPRLVGKYKCTPAKGTDWIISF